MKYTGTIVSVGKREAISDKFSKRTFILTDKTEKYPQTVEFEMQNDNTDFLDVYTEGMLVDVEFNIKGRQWTNPKDNQVKTFNTLVAWKISSPQQSDKGTAPHENNHKDFPFD